MQDAVALSLAFALAAPIRVVLAHAAPEPGAERQYTYLGLFSVSRCHLYAPPLPSALTLMLPVGPRQVDWQMFEGQTITPFHVMCPALLYQTASTHCCSTMHGGHAFWGHMQDR